MRRKTRILNPNFIKDLKEGCFKELLNYVLLDNTLDFEIRSDEVHIYYRGGKALGIKQTKDGTYKLEFNGKYSRDWPKIGAEIDSSQMSNDWVTYFPKAKQVMDFYFSKYSKNEREFQQLVVRENNYSSIANDTDYFILDIEYDNRDNARFDIIALEWPSNSKDRKLQNSFKPKLVIIEMKYGDGALSGTSGMIKHYDDYIKFISNKVSLDEFKDEMNNLFIQKRDLGLIPFLSKSKNNNKVSEFKSKLELIFLIANHKPAKTRLKSEIKKLPSNEIKFITSNYMGYGLYKQNVINSLDFINKLED